MREAIFELERLKVIAELKRFAKEHNEPLNWNALDEFKYCITFNVERRSIYYEGVILVKRNDIYFSSEKLARQAVAKIGEDRIKKYYLGIGG